MTQSEQSPDYQTFYEHVFGDYRYYYYNGLPEDAINKLEGVERQKAEKLILQAIKKCRVDERSVRAAGLFELQDAVPVLKRLITKRNKAKIRISAAWALFKLENDKKYSETIIEVVDCATRRDQYSRYDAIHFLPEFGKEPFIIKSPYAHLA